MASGAEDSPVTAGEKSPSVSSEPAQKEKSESASDAGKKVAGQVTEGEENGDQPEAVLTVEEEEDRLAELTTEVRAQDDIERDVAHEVRLPTIEIYYRS